MRMTKADLIKIISKKAAVTESDAKEFFDLFLQRIAAELNAGESARFSNVGYFCFRKGKIKTESTKDGLEISEFLDLIIFSRSEKFDFKSTDNLVFSVSEPQTSEHDSLDSHFSLSVGKPVLPNLESNDTQYITVHSPEEHERLLKRKIENLMINFNKVDGTNLESELLLVDASTLYDDQLELGLDEKAKGKETESKSDNVLHSSEKLKSIAWGFGKDLSKKMFDESTSKRKKIVDDSPAESKFSSWDFGKRFWNDTNVSDTKEKIDSDRSEENINESGSTDTIKIESPQKSKDDEIKFREINMNDFTISEGNEKIGNYERVRSISSDVGSKDSVKDSEKVLEPTDDSGESDVNVVSYDDEFKKIPSKAERFHSVDKKKPQEESSQSEKSVKSGEPIKLNRTEALRKQRKHSRKNSVVKFLVIIGIMIGLAVAIYYVLKLTLQAEGEKELTQTIQRSDNTTYVERSYEVPVSYPYNKPEKETQIVGLNSNKEIESKTIVTPEKSEQTEQKVVPEKTIKKEEKPITKGSSEKPSGTPVQVAYNIYQYGKVFVVQVAAFRSKSVADQEMRKYVNKGHNSFIEVGEVQGMTWYRVRVGNFHSLESAKQFRKSN